MRKSKKSPSKKGSVSTEPITPKKWSEYKNQYWPNGTTPDDFSASSPLNSDAWLKHMKEHENDFAAAMSYKPDLFAKQDAQVREANKRLEEGDYGNWLVGPDYPVEYKKQQAFFAKKAASAPRLPIDSTARKNIPLASGVLDYFPDALAAVAAVSKAGNDQHNPGEPLHWARGKSMDQGDTLIRHFLERGGVDVDGLRHSAKMAWRALALLQLEIEQEKGLPPSRGSR